MAERDYGAMSRADLVSLVRHLEKASFALSHINVEVLLDLNANMRRVKTTHPLHVDANHTFGVIAEEMAELLDEIRGDHAANQRLELIDIATAALRGVEALDAREGRG